MTEDHKRAIEVVEGCFAAIAKHDADALVAHYTDDYVVEMPYANTERGLTVEGRDTVHGFLVDVLATQHMELTLTGHHWISEESLLIAEYVSEGYYQDTNERYANRYVGYWYLEEGRVRRLREYYNPQAIRPSPDASA